MDSNAEESQNGKEKDKSKAAKQLHSVQKAFGSIGMLTWRDIMIFTLLNVLLWKLLTSKDLLLIVISSKNTFVYIW